jgi:hypothetical protein
MCLELASSRQQTLRSHVPEHVRCTVCGVCESDFGDGLRLLSFPGARLNAHTLWLLSAISGVTTLV